MDPRRFDRIVDASTRRISRRVAIGAAGLAAAALALVDRPRHSAASQATPEGAVEAVDPGWYAAVRRSRFAPGVSADVVARVVREGFAPIVAGVPGFVAYYVVDTGQGGHLTISIFSDPSGPAESSRRSADWVPQALAGLAEGPAEVVAEGEVQVFVAANAATTPSS
jgi:hypothetical protein